MTTNHYYYRLQQQIAVTPILTKIAHSLTVVSQMRHCFMFMSVRGHQKYYYYLLLLLLLIIIIIIFIIMG